LDKKNPIQSHNSFSKNPKIEKESVFLYWKMILKNGPFIIIIISNNNNNNNNIIIIIIGNFLL
jgi:hypothetical protein